jgi:hypothetical protein
MGKRKTAGASRIHRELTERGYTKDGALLRAVRRRTGEAAAQSGVTRRKFIERVALAGAAIGTPALLAACGGSSDDEAPDGPAPGNERRTLFFNLSHLGSADTTHYLNVAGRKYSLTKVGDQPHVLQQAREGNEFLRAVPDDKITHLVEGAEFASGAVTLAYLTCNEQPDTGTWEMTSLYFNIPPGAAAHAYARARAATPSGALALSGKRRAYGLRAAMTEQDLRDEQALVDSNSHAEALVGLHPDLASIEPNSAAHVHNNYISPDTDTQFLALVLQSMGPAVPPGSANVNGATPWATLRPILDETKSPPVPYKKSDGKLNQYFPDWDPQIDENVAPAIGGVTALVKNDESLGADVTGIGVPTAPIGALAGKLWLRRDGIATVVQGASQARADGTLKFDFLHKNGDAGLQFPDPVTTVLADGRVQVRLDNIFNWFLRFLGVYVRFYDANDNVMPSAGLPPDTIPGQTKVESGLNQTNSLFLGVLPPPYTFLGIPVGPGFVSEAFNIPKGASRVTFILGGMGGNGSDAFEGDPDDYEIVGGLMTFFVNFAMVSFFMAIGTSTIDKDLKVIAGIVSAIASELVAILVAVFDWRNVTAVGVIGLMARMLGVILSVLAGSAKGLFALSAALAAITGTAELIDTIPLAGQVARAVAAFVGGVQLAQSFVETAVSPPVYAYDGALTHDLAVNVGPDPKNNQFPQVPAGYTLYYKASYLFDNGTAHVVPSVVVDPAQTKPIPIKFTGIPRGGQVNISIGFYARKSTTGEGQSDWCAGFGTTGLFDNSVDQAPDITIQQVTIPIQTSTQYLHTRKTTLDAQANHVWANTPNGPRFVPPPGGQEPGLGDFRGITVRQGTSQPPLEGYVGYAWKAYSSSVNDCNAGSPGQLDQLANLNTDAGNAGANAQRGYVNGACGMQSGARLGYSLLGNGLLANLRTPRVPQNFYLDSNTLHIRQVQLDPPAFASPQSGESFGRLNMDSTRLLMHPAGHVVSINSENHKIETLKLPGASVSDAVAARSYRARSYSGQGSRPGLVTSPTAAAISPDGVILVLEGSDGNNRIQAFDLGGNPVQFFTKQSKPYFLQLDATPDAQYLDLAVEFTGYLYVLSKDGSNNHRLDIYHPAQAGTSPICTTHGVNAAKLTVDFWRSVYTLNYEVLLLPSGAIPNLTEPSVSLWVPTPPAI